MSAGDHGRLVEYGHHYRVWHSTEPAHVASQVAWLRAMLEPLVGDLPRGSAVDLGCGMGFCVLALESMGFQAAGVERDASQLEACRRLGAPVIESNDLAAVIDERPGLVLITALDILEHVPLEQQPRILHSAHRSLAPGRRLVIQLPNAASPIASIWRHIDWTHTSSFTTISLGHLLKDAGFQEFRWIEREQLRPSLRLWRDGAWEAWRAYLVRRAWRAVLRTELPRDPGLSEGPIDVNLLCVATASTSS